MAGGGRLGAAVVGTGFGVLTHVRAMQRAGFAVHVLVGRDRDKAERRAGLFGIQHVATSLGAALEVGGVDAVAVVTPPVSHCSLVLEAVDAGRHVMCEKPFAMDAAEARSMLEAAERAGVVHFIGTEFRFAPGQAQLTRAVAGGVIGEPKHALLALQLPTLSDPAAEVPGWWEDAAAGGGWLGAQGSHHIDQVLSALGGIDAVCASLRTLAPRPGMTADDTYTVQFRTGGAAMEGTLMGSCATPGPFLSTTRFSGSDATVWIDGGEPWVDDGSGPRPLPVDADLQSAPPEPPPAELLHTAYDMWHSTGIDLDPFTRLYRVMAGRIAGEVVADDPAPATFADGLAAQQVMDAARRSSDAGTWIPVGSPAGS